MVNSEFARPALGDDGDCGGVQEVVTMDNVVRCESLGAIKIECKEEVDDSDYADLRPLANFGRTDSIEDEENKQLELNNEEIENQSLEYALVHPESEYDASMATCEVNIERQLNLDAFDMVEEGNGDARAGDDSQHRDSPTPIDLLLARRHGKRPSSMRKPLKETNKKSGDWKMNENAEQREFDQLAEKIVCHRCRGQMRPCERRMSYTSRDGKPQNKTYKAFRCTKKGCQTFRSLSKLMHSRS